MVLASKEKRQARILQKYLEAGHYKIAYTHALRLLREGKYTVDDDGNVKKVEQ